MVKLCFTPVIVFRLRTLKEGIVANKTTLIILAIFTLVVGTIALGAVLQNRVPSALQTWDSRSSGIQGTYVNCLQHPEATPVSLIGAKVVRFSESGLDMVKLTTAQGNIVYLNHNGVYTTLAPKGQELPWRGIYLAYVGEDIGEYVVEHLRDGMPIRTFSAFVCELP